MTPQFCQSRGHLDFLVRKRQQTGTEVAASMIIASAFLIRCMTGILTPRSDPALHFTILGWRPMRE